MKLGAFTTAFVNSPNFTEFRNCKPRNKLVGTSCICVDSRFPFDKFVIGDERPVLQTIRLGIVQSKKGTIALFLARLSRLE